MERVLLGRANSSNVMKVIWLLEELGLPYDRRDVGGPFGTPSEYAAQNPNNLVPTLIEDGWALWESNAILRYLANTYPTPAWPPSPRARATIDQWMDWQQTVLSRPHSTVFQGLVRHRPEQRDNAAIDYAIEELGRHYGLLERRLSEHDFIAGPEFSLADITIGVHAHRWFSFAFDRPHLPSLRRWYDRLRTRSAYVSHVTQPMT